MHVARHTVTTATDGLTGSALVQPACDMDAVRLIIQNERPQWT